MEKSRNVVVAKEMHGGRDVHQVYTVGDRNKLQIKNVLSGPSRSFFQFFKSAFLPQGYPGSVSADYLDYQKWDTLQAFCSYVTGTLATQAVLKGIGVGDKTATAASATVTWLLKDGAGMVGRVIFAWLRGTHLDSNAKQWRLVADILNDLALLLELLSPLFPLYFLLISCVASVARAVVGVAGGATRAALTVHQARRDNMADVAAKDGSQETLVNLIGLVVGVVLTPLLAGDQALIWTLFIVFTILHLFANYRAVSVVCMETLNHARFRIVVREFFRSGSVPSVQFTNRHEPLFLGLYQDQVSVKLGCRLGQVALSTDELKAVESSSTGLSRYLMRLVMSKQGLQGKLLVAFDPSVTAQDLLLCNLQAELLVWLISNPAAMDSIHGVHAKSREKFQQLKICLQQGREIGVNSDHNSRFAVSLAQACAQALFPTLLSGLEQSGWVTSRVQFNVDEWRSVWDLNGLDVEKDL